MHTSVFFSQTPADQQTPNTLLGRFSATDSPTSSPRPPLYPSGPPSPRTALRRRRLLVPPINHRPSFAACSPPTPRPRRVVRLHDSDGSSGGGSRALGALGGGGWGEQQTHTPTPRARGHRTRGRWVGGAAERRGGGTRRRLRGVLVGTSHPCVALGRTWPRRLGSYAVHGRASIIPRAGGGGATNRRSDDAILPEGVSERCPSLSWVVV